ncbi:MAG: bifunctional [glutamine synthetase] adenylyltransferase/[glutamine synthetase]-adenylyl-L-tyrosine phosphorylase [Pseudomonadota bacterium]
MDLARSITRVPSPVDAGRGQEAVAALGLTGPFADLVRGTAGCSSYLHGLLLKERDWVLRTCQAPDEPPEQALSALGQDAPMLRRDKGRMALLVALLDLGGVWPLEEVTGALSDFADRALDTAMKDALAKPQSQGKLPQEPGLFAIGMGKLGARELNYSSDIDLVLLFEDRGLSAVDAAEHRSQLIRAMRQAMKTLSEVTSEGYVFRTDLRLRPDAAVTPIVLTTGAAEAYYESVGRTWERAAYIKARVAAGDRAAGARFLTGLAPFIWRRHLDFATIEDAHSMLLKIREHKGLYGPITLPGHDMKLGRGGIREIEFFAQTHQLIAGGRNGALRERATRPALRALAKAGRIDEAKRATLDKAYLSHREIEHRLQMLRDAQTHSLPHSDEGFARLAAFMGLERAALDTRLRETLEATRACTEPFFAPAPAPAPAARVKEPAASLDFGRDITDRWMRYPAMRSERAVRVFERVRPRLMERLSKAREPERALHHFDAFLAGLPAGVQLFSLFEANPDLVDLVADIAAIAPALAEYLGRNAQVFDAVLDGGFFAPWPGKVALAQDLSEKLAALEDYEGRLDMARIWAKEWHFRIGVHFLRALSTAEEAGAHYAELAEAVIRALFPVVTEQFALRHGAPPGRGAAIVAMGSLGAGRAHPASDLDLILIYDAAEETASKGPRPLAVRPYYARLTQAFITALSAQTARGRLYEVDMRLRPSGRNGPLATSLPAFEAYQSEDAWTWEHLALTRARPIAGDAAVMRSVERVRCDVIAQERDAGQTSKDIAAMRARIFKARPGEGGLAAKDGPGRLQDLELFAQSLALAAKSDARALGDQIAAGSLSEEEKGSLRAHEALLWHVRVVTRLVLKPAASAPDVLGEAAAELLLRETGLTSQSALISALEDGSKRCAKLFESNLAGEQGAR